MKKIRIEYYRYRVRKGRADVLLQKVEESESFCVPFRYAMEEDRIERLLKNGEIDDDGDLVIRFLSDHKNFRSCVWIPLGDLQNTRLERNDQLDAYKTIIRLFLSSPDIKPEFKSKVEEWYDAVLLERAKRRYIEILKDAYEGHGIIVTDAYAIPPSKEVFEKELETLQHFKPKRQGDEYCLDIDWEAVGWKFEYINLGSWPPKIIGLIDGQEGK